MTETQTNPRETANSETDPEPTTDQSSAEPDDEEWPEPKESSSQSSVGGYDLTDWFEIGGLVGLAILGAVAAVGFYTSAGAAIARLVSPEFEPIFQAVFNLVVFLVALVGVSLLLRRRSSAST